jgi:hypothetical protein
MSKCQRCIDRPLLRYETNQELSFCSEECALDLWNRSRRLIGVKRGRGEQEEEEIVRDPRLLLALPKDVLVLVLENLSLMGLLQVARTSQYLRNVIQEKSVWERVIGRPIPEYARGNEIAFGYAVQMFDMHGYFRGENRNSFIIETTLSRMLFASPFASQWMVAGTDAVIHVRRGRYEIVVPPDPNQAIRVLFNFWANGYRYALDVSHNVL